MTDRAELEAAISSAKSLLRDAEFNLSEFEARAENNVFETLEDADGKIEDKLLAEAHADCEGSYNCGDESYTQDFMVGGLKYRGTLNVEYNRHDKTYYYIDGSDYSSALIDD
jgi:hypothetical protein